ncbi:protein YgfX [Veronia nyctiphanis]|uniref:protein YgfX n=1 Tax=Veronia nyctiphanis TaxID=1278244 RepID=UPI0038B44F49
MYVSLLLLLFITSAFPLCLKASFVGILMRDRQKKWRCFQALTGTYQLRIDGQLSRGEQKVQVEQIVIFSRFFILLKLPKTSSTRFFPIFSDSVGPISYRHLARVSRSI